MKCIKKFLIQWASLSLFLAMSSVGTAETIHIGHCLAGCPETSGEERSNVIVVRHLYAASVSYDSGLADWVSYRVLPDTIGVASLLPRFWEVDDLLSDVVQMPQFSQTSVEVNQPSIAEQQDSEYRTTEVVIREQDWGRLVPMSSFAGTPYWAELNTLSNLAPLPANLRLGAWSRLDQAVNEAVSETGGFTVISGPVYDGEGLSNRSNFEGTQPPAFFKVIASDSAVAAFVFDAELQPHADFCTQLSSLSEVQNRTGLVLFPNRTEGFSGNVNESLGCR